MSENESQAVLTVDDRRVELGVLRGTLGGRAVDCGGLKAKAGCYAFDPSLMNTMLCRSDITFVDCD